MKYTIRSKLLMSFGVIILLMIFVDYVQQRGIETLVELNRQIKAHPLVVTRSIYLLDTNVGLIITNLVKINYSDNKESIINYANSIRGCEQKALKQFDRITKTILGNIGLQATNRILNFFHDWRAIREKFIAAKLNGDMDAAENLFRESEAHAAILLTKLDALRKYPAAKATYFNVESEMAAEYLYFITRAAQYISLIFGVGIALLISIPLGNRINILTSAAEKIAGGYLRIRIPEKGNDEISLLIKYFNMMAKSLDKSFELLSKDLTLSRNSLEVMTEQLYDEMEERGRIQEKIAESEKFFRSILEDIHMVAVQLDRSGTILFVNDYLLLLTGWEREEILGKNWMEVFIQPEEREAITKVYEEFIKTSGSVHQHFENAILTRYGELRYISWSSMAVTDIDGNATSDVAIGEDVTLRRLTEEDMNRHRQYLEDVVANRTKELAAVNRELEAFAYSVSHDLRAPLRSISGFSDALMEDYADVITGDGKNYLLRLRAGALRMGTLIDDLLKLSRITRQEMKLAQVNLTEMAAAIVEELRNEAPQRPVETLITANLTVKGDRNLLHAMMWNLMENAWKFTSKTAFPKIEFGETGADGDKIFYIRDNGAGFKMAYADKLFKAFQRLHAVDDFDGTGIGLATVQRIVNRHGGAIWAEGEPGKGAVFYFKL